MKGDARRWLIEKHRDQQPPWPFATWGALYDYAHAVAKMVREQSERTAK